MAGMPSLFYHFTSLPDLTPVRKLKQEPAWLRGGDDRARRPD